MLVLSRKVNESVVFPDLPATVKIAAVRGGCVRLGIEAPRGVGVFRSELAALAGVIADPQGLLPRDLAHSLRNRLNAATIGLELLRRQKALGLHAESDATLARITSELEAMHAEVMRPLQPARRSALLVEDDGNQRELLAGVLRMAGLEVQTAGDGVDALEYLRTRTPDVVLLDMGLPRCDGPATLREIRRDPARARLKVFAVTGRSPEEFPSQAGVDRWFRKPVQPEELLRELNRELAGVA